MGVEMHHREFLDILHEVENRGVLFFKLEGRIYTGRIEELWLGDSSRAALVFPEVFVKEGLEFVELEENGPRHIIFDWLKSKYVWLSGDSSTAEGKICLITEEGPIYICLFVKQAEATQEEPVAEVA